MTVQGRLGHLLSVLWGNWIALLGTTIVTVTGNAMLIVLVTDLVTGGLNQYVTAFGYLVMPPAFIGGLVLIAVGTWRQRRGRRGKEPTVLDRAVGIALADRPTRLRLAFVVAATLIGNVTLVSVVTYQAVVYMDTPRFCGTLCHTIMHPQYQAYLRSPHARVTCVDCHIGSGASWFVRYKFSGMRQVWGALTGRFERPIPTPVQNLRPARETCEHCHWPQRFGGFRILTRYHYQDDQANTQQVDVVRLKVQGRNPRSGHFEGIHWHVAPGVRITYESLDRQRTKIGKIVLDAYGKESVFAPPAGQKAGPVVERRVMDCVDCHNQPTHIFATSPAMAVDAAMACGRLDPELPFLHEQSVRLLKTRLDDPARASALFSAELASYYRQKFPQVAAAKKAAIAAAGLQLGAIYEQNIFPKMKVWWGTYPRQIGHQEQPYGCWRCHDDAHQTPKGKTIPQDCDLCHEVLAQDEQKPDVPEWMLKLGCD